MKDVNKKLMEKFANANNKKSSAKEENTAKAGDYNKRKEAREQYTQVNKLYKN